jgi:HD superfamily phosphohydrolase
MGDGELLPRIKAFAEEFAARNLGQYLVRLGRPGEIGSDPKEINDSVWGTVKVSPLEVVLIDSPLLQRLRLIRQLGVVHWVYPGASHSRFEHTLGVLHQAQRVIAAINQSFGPRETSAITPKLEQLVRLCALSHDIGHGVFSHVSEHALARRTDLRLALAAFREAMGVDKIQLSELIAYYFVGSPAFNKMLELAFDRLEHPLAYGGGSAGIAGTVTSKIQQAIIGLRIDDEVPLLHEIITGPFDADKLDYYVRDAQHAGVPSLLDVSRLLQKIVHRRVPMRDVPDDIKKTLPRAQESCELFGLKASGAPLLDELHLARVLLYAKIYRQKKVLAIEAMVDALFGALGALPGIDPVKLVELCYTFSDDQLVVSSSSDVLRAIAAEGASDEIRAFIDDLLARLRNRHLYVNSLALLATYPDDPWGEEKTQNRGLKDLMNDCANPQKVAELQKALAAELVGLMAALPEAVDGLPAENLEMGVVISTKPKLSGGTEIDRALILQGERFVRGRDMDRMNQSAWVDAYHFGQPHSHLFAPKEGAVATYVAAEKLLRRRYNVVLPSSALALSKQNAASVTRLKASLDRVGWYAGVPLDIRPQPERLSRADIDDRVQQLAVRLEVIDEPIGTLMPRRAAAMAERIKSWLAQHRDDAAIEGALEAIERVRILSREDSNAALRAFVEKHPEFRGATIVPFGELKDSGAVQAYLSRDLEAIFPRVATVKEATEAGGDQPILFVDDFVGSGSQARDMIGSWFEDSDLMQEHLGESRLPFQERERKFLTERKVGFAFVAGWDMGVAAVKEAAAKVGMTATVEVHILESEIPFAFEGIDRTPTSVAFERESLKIGKELLVSNGKDAEKQRTRALGYGNRAMLLTTRFNVPTQTLTSFWMDGEHDGVEWHALIRRKNKK